jgi:hypothetical protein
MSTKKISQLVTAAVANLSTTTTFPVVDASSNTVKASFGNLVTAMNVITSLTGDGTATGPGAAVFTLAARKVTNAYIATAAVTAAEIATNTVAYAQLQQVTAPALVGRGSAGAGDLETVVPSTGHFVMTTNVMILAPAITGALGSPTTTTVDVTMTGTALVNVTTLAIAVSANAKYSFDFTLIWQTNDAANGFKCSATFPASATAILLRTEIQNAVAQSTTAITYEMGTAGDSAATGVATVDTANANRWARISGWLSNGPNAGNIQVRMACVGSAVPIITAKAGSFGVLKAL